MSMIVKQINSAFNSRDKHILEIGQSRYATVKHAIHHSNVLQEIRWQVGVFPDTEPVFPSLKSNLDLLSGIPSNLSDAMIKYNSEIYHLISMHGMEGEHLIRSLDRMSQSSINRGIFEWFGTRT